MKIQKKFTSFILVIAMIASIFTTFTMSASATAAAVRPPSYSTNVTARRVVIPLASGTSMASQTVVVTQSGTQHASITGVKFEWFVTADNATTGAAIESAAQAQNVLSDLNASETALNDDIPVGTYRAVCKITFDAPGVIPTIEPVYTRIVDISVSRQLNANATLTSAAVAASGTEVPTNATLSLATESLIGGDLTNFTIRSYSVNNGGKWTALRGNGLVAGSTEFTTLLARLINRGMTLRISDQAIDRATKQPALGGTTYIFPAVAARPKAQRYVVNYAVGTLAATTTDLGANRWALTARGATTALTASVTNALEIGRLEGRNRVPETWYVYGSATNTSLRNIVTIDEAEGARNASWAYRTAATVRTNNNGVQSFTPASAPIRVRVLTEARAPRLRFRLNAKEGGGSLRYRAGTTITSGTTTTTYTDAGELTFAAGSSQSLTIRLAATARRPRSAAQTLEGDMPAAPTSN